MAKEWGVHPRTVVRIAKKLEIPMGELSDWDEQLIKNNILKFKPKPQPKPTTIKITDYITQTDAAAIIGVTRQAIYKWMKAGKIIVVEVAGQQYIAQGSAEAIRDERRSIKQEGRQQ